MRIEETQLSGLYVIKSTPIIDGRGSFMRAYCYDTFCKYGLNVNWLEENISNNKLCGTLRGLHYQKAPYAEIKLVQCIHGKIYDVAVDIRVESPTYKHWFGVELSADSGCMLYIPEGFAHGYQALTDDATVYYHMSQPYHEELSCGIHHEDPDIAIKWPMAVEHISERDLELPFLK